MLTAFYMFRLYFNIFHHKTPSAALHHGDGGIFMKIPLIILSICTLLAGFIPFSSYISADHIPTESVFNPGFTIIPVCLSVIGILFAARLYYKQNDLPDQIAKSFGLFYRSAYRKFYIDEIYLFFTRKIIFNLIGRPAAWIDKHIIDGFMNMLATVTAALSVRIRSIQSGRVQGYALCFFAGLMGLALVFIYLWKTP